MRDVVLTRNFPPKGKPDTVIYVENGITVDCQAVNYRRKTARAKQADTMTSEMVTDGGVALAEIITLASRERKTTVPVLIQRTYYLKR